MKHAFTMIELVFVIVIVGIISVMIAPNFQGNNLRQAADQVVSHIRYTQHLAMMDNKFSTTDVNWFRSRWQLKFHRSVDGINNIWSYSIFSDKVGFSGEPDEPELAKNPLNSDVYLTGGFSGGVIPVTSSKRIATMALGLEYGINDVKFSPSCTNNQGINQSRRISFDYVGRPFQGDLSNSISWKQAYQSNKLIQLTCNIILSNSDSNVTILVEPETGYTHIL